ncbi:lysylphosphatidylglycerol synthase transmembrane domain-containing protein [Ichthyenterobacterium sp. W332]|uniref:Lysylphosphatidylglycerol synthase transmembrane domain-containing protein n=1 Tax=Microcosmobacter mediterraneus TaxID=3075607 RepID=A0ABU2YIZ6_9FLAO|nr:lysylphosphatidylglycerol synthase transmembrane domain-containing protein [Ichthyenterobacterium sp. W332]MDT0557861.1 lysylphosphatidylglycerol synthase transmembrane domain-containing protein [Ichthyenterobacterium sp. W332]
MTPKQKKILTILIPILISVGLVWYSLNKVPLDKIIAEAKQADLKWILLSVVCLTISHISRAYRWLFMLEPLGYNVKFKNSMMAVFATYLINYGIPRSGEVARATILTNYEGVPFEKGFGTIVAERIADLIVMLGIISITLILQFDFIIEFFQKKFSINTLIIFGGVTLMLIILFFVFRKSESGIAKKINDFIKGLLEGAVSILKMKKKWPFIAHTLFIWGLYVLMFYTTTFAFESLKGIPIAAVLIGFISASFSIAATNGGTGAYPAAVYAAFSIFGIAEDPSFAFGWVLWGSQTLMTIILGGLSLLYLPIYNRKANVASE